MKKDEIRIEDYSKYFSNESLQKGETQVLNECHESSNGQNFLVSIVTVVFNAEECLESTICSIIAQSYPHIEYIVVDGASTDGTLSVIQQYKEKINYWISEPDRGLYDAMNKGISLCHGELIGILNAGDLYLPDAVAQVVETYRMLDTPSIVAGNCKCLLKSDSKWFIRSGSSKALPYNTIAHPSTFVPKEIYESQGLFDYSYKIAGDYDFLCRCFVNHVNFVHLDRVIAVADIPGLSSKYYKTAREEFRVRLRHNLSFSRTLIMLIRSYVTISVHLMLEFLGLWQIVERRRHGTVRR